MIKLRGILGISLIISLLLGITFTLGLGLQRVKAADELEAKLDVFLEALDIVKNEHVEKDLDNTELIYGSIRGLLKSLDDPYSRFMEPKAFKEMRIRLGGLYEGIGIYIGLKDHQLLVISPIEGTPAYRAGLKAKDNIVSIDGKSTKDMALEEAVSLIRGTKGTPVVLGIMRGEAKEPKEYTIIREKIVIKSVKKKTIEEDMGYIKLISFESEKAASEMEKALKEFKKKRVKGLILDLRGNGGGLLANAIQIGNMFMGEGVVVYTVDREGRKEAIRASRGRLWEGPLVVLVDESSASASEILAGAIQDNKIGTLVGTHTFGKASVQNIRRLSDGSAVLITVAKYLTPSLRDITKKGVEPEVIVEIPERPTEEAESLVEEEEEEDLQLEKAIQILKEKIEKGETAPKDSPSYFWESFWK